MSNFFLDYEFIHQCKLYTGKRIPIPGKAGGPIDQYHTACLGIFAIGHALGDSNARGIRHDTSLREFDRMGFRFTLLTVVDRTDENQLNYVSRPHLSAGMSE